MLSAASWDLISRPYLLGKLVIVIIWLMLSVSLCPKVITLSGFCCNKLSSYIKRINFITCNEFSIKLTVLNFPSSHNFLKTKSVCIIVFIVYSISALNQERNGYALIYNNNALTF
jgi:hypothetical protein